MNLKSYLNLMHIQTNEKSCKLINGMVFILFRVNYIFILSVILLVCLHFRSFSLLSYSVLRVMNIKEYSLHLFFTLRVNKRIER